MTPRVVLALVACLLLASVASGVGSDDVAPACVAVDGVDDVRRRYADWGGVYVPAYLLVDTTYLDAARFDEVGLRPGFELLAGFLGLAGRGHIERRIAMLHLDPCTLRAGYLDPLTNTGLLARVGWTPSEVLEVLRWIDDYLRRYGDYMARSVLFHYVATDPEPGEHLALGAVAELRLLREMRDDPFVSAPRLTAASTAYRDWLGDERVAASLGAYHGTGRDDVLAFRAAFDLARVTEPPAVTRRFPARPDAVFAPGTWGLEPRRDDAPVFTPVLPNLVDRIDFILGPVAPPAAP